MAAVELTYSDYVYLCDGKLEESEFDALAPRASQEVANLCMFRDVPEYAVDHYKRAIAAVIDVFSEHGVDASAGFSIGSFSMQSGAESPREIAFSRARSILFPTGLLYAGIEG